MEYGVWSMEYGAWSMEHGAWDDGVWSMEYGVWSTVWSMRLARRRCRRCWLGAAWGTPRSKGRTLTVPQTPKLTEISPCDMLRLHFARLQSTQNSKRRRDAALGETPDAFVGLCTWSWEPQIDAQRGLSVSPGHKKKNTVLLPSLTSDTNLLTPSGRAPCARGIHLARRVKSRILRSNRNKKSELT